eukprot:11132619-Heterocapsa_arctica.AAC.1
MSTVMIPRPGTVLAWMVVLGEAALSATVVPSPRCLRRSDWSFSRSARCHVALAPLLAPLLVSSADSRSEKVSCS